MADGGGTTNQENHMMIVNQFPGTCRLCGCRVPARGGVVIETPDCFALLHLACEREGSAQVEQVFSVASDTHVRRNVNGRCEDAPCCGCCD